jgi:hypothetical protein
VACHPAGVARAAAAPLRARNPPHWCYLTPPLNTHHAPHQASPPPARCAPSLDLICARALSSAPRSPLPAARKCRRRACCADAGTQRAAMRRTPAGRRLRRGSADALPCVRRICCCPLGLVVRRGVLARLKRAGKGAALPVRRARQQCLPLARLGRRCRCCSPLALPCGCSGGGAGSGRCKLPRSCSRQLARA